MNKLFKQEKKKEKFDFDLDKSLKTAVALPVVAGGILVGTKLIGKLAE